MTTLALALELVLPPSVVAPNLFDEQATAQVRSYWQGQNRWQFGPRQIGSPWEAVATGRGSAWIHAYYRARNPQGRILPTQDPPARNAREQAWDQWIEQAYRTDEQNAAIIAAARNAGSPEPPLKARPAIPADLKALAGEPPLLVEARRPLRHTIQFDDYRVTFEEAPNVRRKYPYFRFEDGVASSPSAARAGMVAAMGQSGLNARDMRIFAAIAGLEGGFHSINTYDTGFVSVGFLQFASLREGRGSLGQLMARYKARQPQAFQRDFRRFGIDVTADGMLVVLNLTDGIERAGPDAALAIVRDKRLAAVFERAGAISPQFQAAQIAAARDLYNPRTLPISVSLPGRTLTGTAGDVIQSEAGLATLLDRLVNTGRVSDLSEAVSEVMLAYGLRTLAEARAAEYQIIERLTWRHNFLTAGSLSRPTDQSVLLANRARSAPPSLQGDLGTAPLDPTLGGVSVPGMNVAPNLSGNLGTLPPVGGTPRPAPTEATASKPASKPTKPEPAAEAQTAPPAQPRPRGPVTDPGT